MPRYFFRGLGLDPPRTPASAKLAACLAALEKLSNAAVVAASEDLIAATATSLPAGADLAPGPRCRSSPAGRCSCALRRACRVRSAPRRRLRRGCASSPSGVSSELSAMRVRRARSSWISLASASARASAVAWSRRALGEFELHSERALGAVHGDAGEAGGRIQGGVGDVCKRVGVGRHVRESWKLVFRGMVRRNNSILGRGEGACQANFGALHHRRRVRAAADSQNVIK